MKTKQDVGSVIVSSRVRLARNLEGIPFKTKEAGALSSVAETIKKSDPGFSVERISELGAAKSQALFEQHLISRELLENKNGIALLRAGEENNTKRICVMIGEEDHIRVQVIDLGLNLRGIFDSAFTISNEINKKHNVAFSNEIGYLTSCPTNLGTGMRASVMLFLPALTKTGRIDAIANMLRADHITVRGTHGEGSEAGGYMYQISNQSCLGMSEQQILEKVERVAVELAQLELTLHAELMKNNPDEIKNQVMISLGILTHAHMISSAQAVDNLAWLKLGDCLGIVRFKKRILDDLFFIIQPATLAIENEKAGKVVERDKLRASKIARILNSSRIK